MSCTAIVQFTLSKRHTLSIPVDSESNHSPLDWRRKISTRGSDCETRAYSSKDSRARYWANLNPRSYPSVEGKITSIIIVGFKTVSWRPSPYWGGSHITTISGYV